MRKLDHSFKTIKLWLKDQFFCVNFPSVSVSVSKNYCCLQVSLSSITNHLFKTKTEGNWIIPIRGMLLFSTCYVIKLTDEYCPMYYLPFLNCLPCCFSYVQSDWWTFSWIQWLCVIIHSFIFWKKKKSVTRNPLKFLWLTWKSWLSKRTMTHAIWAMAFRNIQNVQGEQEVTCPR